ncbi:MAG: ABC transporter ATP-binding protein [Methylobacterium sp.]|nr:ABC transporter ATP-binding protein [Methylobacterium sp.]MCA3601898.1 ABC transporter ATP-binding protein [Methylobacterium sp.]MCA3605147.1 ABC transporter ATP-binding protein [Methylobacterium sp.]MCA3608834.1 ABC transporter ATP-binding protein [Methylobacterium sp.]MCA3616694.1 ABC transporter ATP-binding protein [Methylobacterium sp.]
MNRMLEARNLHKSYILPRASWWERRVRIEAVRDVSLHVQAGETLGIVGESGSGKSTLARLLMALERPDSGRLFWQGEEITVLSAAELRARRHGIQMVFQDPYGSLDPRMRILDTVAEPLDVAEPGLAREQRHARVAEMLERVGLNADMLARYPHQFSGGQRQRIAIARALITRPRILVADEPASALDVSIQAQILNLLGDLKLEFGLAMVFISHDLGIVRYLADRMMVMRHGVVVEEGETERVFTAPEHPYTRALIAAMPKLETD